MRNYKEIDIDYEAAVRLSDYADEIHVAYHHDNSGSWYCYQITVYLIVGWRRYTAIFSAHENEQFPWVNPRKIHYHEN